MTRNFMSIEYLSFLKKIPRLKFCSRSDLTQSAVDFNFKQLAGTHLIEIVVSYITDRLRKHDSSILSIRINFKRFAVSWQVTHDPHRHLTPVTVSTLPSSHDLKKVNPATRKKIWIYYSYALYFSCTLDITHAVQVCNESYFRFFF